MQLFQFDWRLAWSKKDSVFLGFQEARLGDGLTTADIVYRRPDRHWLLQTYVWQVAGVRYICEALRVRDVENANVKR